MHLDINYSKHFLAWYVVVFIDYLNYCTPRKGAITATLKPANTTHFRIRDATFEDIGSKKVTRSNNNTLGGRNDNWL